MKKVSLEGRFIYKDMSREPLISAIMNRLHDLVLAQQWIHYVDIKNVKKIFLENGFQVIASRKRILFWYAHEMVIFQRKK